MLFTLNVSVLVNQ